MDHIEIMKAIPIRSLSLADNFHSHKPKAIVNCLIRTKVLANIPSYIKYLVDH